MNQVMSKSIMSIAVMCDSELTEVMNQVTKEDTTEWCDPDLPSMILKIPMQLFRGLPMHPIMIKWAGEFFVHFIYLEFHTRLLLFFLFTGGHLMLLTVTNTHIKHSG